MDAKELRIGNWVLQDGVPTQITGYMFHAEFEGLYEIEDEFYPIPLTPEILEKIGGKNRGGWIGYFYDAEVYGEDVRIVWQLMDGGISIFANDNLIKYEDSPTVHSFQNSVYYLTGEELPIVL